MILVNAKKLVSDFGGLSAATHALNDIGHPITKNAVDKWRRRNSLPTESLCAFAILAKRKNQRFDQLDYIMFSRKDGEK